MAFEYSFEFYPLEIFREVTSAEPRHIFICLTDGKCKVEEKHPEFGKLNDLLKEKCRDNFEVVQLFFQERGVLVLYRRAVSAGG